MQCTGAHEQPNLYLLARRLWSLLELLNLEKELAVTFLCHVSLVR